jgi:hypothetical protein
VKSVEQAQKDAAQYKSVKWPSHIVAKLPQPQAGGLRHLIHALIYRYGTCTTALRVPTTSSEYGRTQ